MITITDEVGHCGSVTVDEACAADAIRNWFPTTVDLPSGNVQDVRADVKLGLAGLQMALDCGEYDGAFATYLGISIAEA